MAKIGIVKLFCVHPFNSEKSVTIANASQVKALKADCEALYNLGNLTRNPKYNGLFISKFSRETLYKYYAPHLDYSKIDFAWPKGYPLDEQKMECGGVVWYYPEGFIFGEPVYDVDVLANFAQEVCLCYDNRTGEEKEYNIYG